MQKPALIRAIFAELRDSLGPDVPAGDLLRIAGLILASYVNLVDPKDAFRDAPDERGLDTLAVDIAIERAWSVLKFEYDRAHNVDELDYSAFLVLSGDIDRYLGQTWRQDVMPKGSPNLYRPTLQPAPYRSGRDASVMVVDDD